MFDAIVIGGSFAGLSAAVQLARARCRIAVIDAGLPRNRFAARSHGFLGQDGRPPGDILADGRRQLQAYPSVQWIEGTADAARPTGQGHEVKVGELCFEAKRLLLATGVADELPPIPGLAERWGRSVFHCPYCHAYELQRGHIGVLAAGPMSMHHALMLPDWGRVTLLLNDAFAPDAAQARALADRGVTVEAGPVQRILSAATVELAGGQRLAFDGLFTLSRTRMASPLAEQLGCAFDEAPLGQTIRRDTLGETTVPGVFACGDAARPFGNVATAVGDGAFTGAAVHRSLVFGLGSGQ